MRKRRTQRCCILEILRRASSVLLLSVIGSAQSSVLPVQLDKNTFTSYINNVSSHQGLLIEFYANWCPSCQHFAPTYEKVAQYFNAEPKVKPEVSVARVDCATEHEVCSEYGIGKYPTLKFGSPAAFKEEATQKLEEFTRERTAVEVVKWVGEQRAVEYNYDPSQESQEERKSFSTAAVVTEAGIPLTITKQADLQDIQKATVLAFKYALDAPELLKGEASRSAFINFTNAVAAAHPIDRCRNGATHMQAMLPKLWPADRLEGPNLALRSIAICESADESMEWRACKGSRDGTRGYTCGLWMLFHSLAGRLPPQESSGSTWMTAVKGYVKHFFQCSDCAQHFTEMASEAAANAVKTQKEAVLWAWRAHNEVNRRLEAVEKSSGDGDAAFPKKQWPPSELCPLCRLASLAKSTEVTWNEEEVYRFLQKFYLAEPQKGARKLPKSFGFGGRRNLELRGGASLSRHVTPLLVVAGLLAAVGCVARQRMRRGRKIVSL